MLKIKNILTLIIILLTVVLIGYCLTYTSQYPTHDTDHVKATTDLGANHEPWLTTDPAKSLIGSDSGNSWTSNTDEDADQRFHIDLGSGKAIRRIYYENYHSAGTYTDVGVQNFTFWGSNAAGSFAELTYGTDTGWVELTCSQNTFDQHVGANQADPKYIVVTNTTEYQYYAIKCADTWGATWGLGIRRVELQTEDGWPPIITNVMFMFSDF